MESVTTEETNMVLKAPSGWNHDNMPISDLHVTKVNFTEDDKEAIPGFQSYWKPSDEELEILKAGGVVVLTLLGNNHPPVAMGTIGARKIEQQA